MELERARRDKIDDVYRQIENNFIADERRSYADFVRAFESGKFVIYLAYENGVWVSFACVWEIDGGAFVEYLVVLEQYRCGGFGGKTLQLLKDNYRRIVLEAEPPVKKDQIRRINFYNRNGFHMNMQDYWQPAYTQEGSPCYLKLMSYPSLLDDFEAVKKNIYKEVYNKHD